MTEIPGYCETCRWRRQEWVLTDEKMMLDTWCDLLDLFVPHFGFCHFYEEEVVL